jgi:hypothetical protein
MRKRDDYVSSHDTEVKVLKRHTSCKGAWLRTNDHTCFGVVISQNALHDITIARYM